MAVIEMTVNFSKTADQYGALMQALDRENLPTLDQSRCTMEIRPALEHERRKGCAQFAYHLPVKLV